MILPAKIILFLLGMGVCVQLIAALYGFIDLKYTFRTAYTSVLRRILIWFFGAAVVYRLLTDSLRSAFLWGVVAYFLIYIVIFGFYQLLFAHNTKIVKSK